MPASKRLCWGAGVFPNDTLTSPLLPYLSVRTIQPVPHFPDSMWFYSLSVCYLLCATNCLISIYSMLLFHHLHYNEIKLGGERLHTAMSHMLSTLSADHWTSIRLHEDLIQSVSFSLRKLGGLYWSRTRTMCWNMATRLVITQHRPRLLYYTAINRIDFI